MLSDSEMLDAAEDLNMQALALLQALAEPALADLDPIMRKVLEASCNTAKQAFLAAMVDVVAVVTSKTAADRM